jgi:hypothetical protein
MFKEGFDPTTIPLGPPPGSEEGHGITIKDFKNTLSEKELGDRNFEKITDYFFEYTFPSNNNL